MMRILGVLFVFMSCCTFGQASAAWPAFEVVDIRLNKSGESDASGTILPSGQFRAINMPVREIIKFAYRIRDEALIGAPAWIDTDHYDIIAKGPPTGTEETFWRSSWAVVLIKLSYNNWDQPVRLMVQSLLAERFKLAVHEELRPLGVYALVVMKNGPKFQKAADSGKPECTRKVDMDGGLHNHAQCTSVTMADLGRALQTLAGLYAGRNVVDSTGIQGAYDLKLDWEGRPNVEQGGLTLAGAMDKQLGLKLESRKLPMPVILIDHVERPSEN